MKTLLAGMFAATALTFALAGAPASAADADPSLAQIYDAAKAGHLDQAQQMIEQVLRDHPASSKAHYVQAELYAREGNLGLARAELAKAEQLKPGLPDENPRAVQELKSQLGVGVIRRGGERPIGMQAAPAPAGFAAPGTSHFPWVTVVILALVAGVFLMLFRRRNTYVPYSTGGVPGGAPGGYGPGGYVGPGGGGMIGGGGIGSNIAGGLAGGLAAGAGIVAGEELAHHFLDGNQRSALPPADEGQWNSSNSDMGGNDFGVNDPGSWDDGSSGGDSGGGGGDWS
jgi:uncharacterized protein